MVAVGFGALVTVAAHLGLAIAAEASLAVRDPVYADRAARLDRVEREAAGGPVVLVLGTSRTGNGFDARRAGERLTAKLGRPVAAFNFGLPASGPVTHRVHLARLLADGRRPALLLVEVLPPSVAKLPGGPLEALYLDGRRFRRDELDVLAEYGIPGRVREEWRETVTAPWAGLRFPILGRLAPSALPAHRRHDESRTCDAYGWHRVWEEVLTPELMADARDRTRRDYGPILRDLHPGGDAGRALRDTLRLAREHGIPTRIVLMPEAGRFRDMYSPAAAARFDRWIGGVARETGCPVIDARRWVPDSGFVDGHHLLPGGAAAFTDKLTDEVLAPHLAAATGSEP